MRPANGERRLARLLPRREVAELARTLSPLLEGLRWRVLDLSGAVHHEQASEAGAAHGWDDAGFARVSLGVDGAEVGTLQVASEPGFDVDAVRACEVLRGLLERALAAGAVQRDLAAETLERYREVHLAYRLSELLTVGLDIDALPARLLHEALRVVDAPCAVLRLAGGVAASVGVDEGDERLGTLLAEVERRAGGRTQIDTEPLGLAADLERAHAVRLWTPLQSGDETVGTLLLTRPEGQGVFAAGDAKLLAALATQAATTLQNARLQHAAVAQARLERELQLAHDVQATLMPRHLPSGSGWSLAGWWSAARQVAGDFYDATRDGDAVALTVGDVADKGMAAALFMALSRSVLRASAGDGRGPGAVLTRANALLCADAADGMFVTLVHAQLAPDGTVRYANAGHNPPLLLRVGGSVERLERTGMLVGWDEGAGYGEASVRLDPGDALVLYTDGISEARDAHGDEYGEVRLLELLRSRAASAVDAAEVVAALRSDLAAFVGDAEPFDDATVVVALRTRPDDDAGQGAQA